MTADAGPRADLGAWVGDRFGVRVTTISSAVGLQVDDLVGIGLRRNPRRAHLLVSTVLGKHIPVDPGLVIGTGRLLGELVFARLADSELEPGWPGPAQHAVRHGAPADLVAALDAAVAVRAESPDLVLGFAETATSLGHLVADQLRAACYLHSTRRHVPDAPLAGTFEEGHSHATSHLLLPVPPELLDSPGPLVLVDDELSTGTTAMQTILTAHGRHPRPRYVVACLIDLRSPADEQRMQALAADLGCRIDVVSLARGTVELPADLLTAVGRAVERLDAAAATAAAPDARSAVPPTDAPVTSLPWPSALPDGGRHGFLLADQRPFSAALSAAVTVLRETVRRRLEPTGGRSVVVVGVEELMYLPLRMAEQLALDPAWQVTFQSTTRSPVLQVDDAGYPVRRRFTFADAEGDAAQRFLYNVGTASAGTGLTDDPDLVVLVADAAADVGALCGAGGPADALRRAGLQVEVAVLGAVDIHQLARRRTAPVSPEPLVGPGFGSYRPDEVRWLLTDLSDVALEGAVADREAAIQAGTAHYAESLPIEYQPDTAYRELFDRVLLESADRLARAVGLVTEVVLRERGPEVVLASLARAGTPIGVLMRRWASFRHGLTLPHYALSIVRGRGIDTVALRYLAQQHDSRSVVFVDGWTGKGAIAVELTAALQEARTRWGLDFDDDLAVLADPGHCVRTFGTRDDFLIASACLNSTVSGLVSRTVLNADYIGPGQFHGAKYYRELAPADVSNVLLDTVSGAFPAVVADVDAGLDSLLDSDRAPTFAGWAAIEAIRAEYGIESVNFVKPGVGETTRVLLRRVPWRILVRQADDPDHDHLRLLARQRNVPIEVRPDLPYSCVGLIKRLSAAEPGEG